MKLGTETGSLTNHLLANVALGEVKPGDGCTICMWSDRHAATVLKTTAKTITVQYDKATRTDTNGMSDSQSYAYEADPAGRVVIFRKNKTGRWKSTDGSFLSLGKRESYHDFSF